MDSSAIQLIQETAIAAMKANRLPTEVPTVVLTDRNGAQQIVSLEPFQKGRERFRGTYSTSSFDDFVEYVRANRGEPAPTFVDPDHMSAAAYFNLGNESEPGHGDWKAGLKLKPTAPFAALCDIDGKKLKQKELAEFLEDWNEFVAAEYPNGDGDLKRAITGIRKIQIDKRAESVHGVTATGASRSEMEQIEAKADELPIGFTWVCEPYVGLKSRPFRLALSVLTTGEVPLVVLRWQRREAVLEDIAKEFKTTLEGALAEDATVSVGTFSA